MPSPVPATIARTLAARYGHVLERPVVYTQGVALTARLELALLDAAYPDPRAEIADIVAPYLSQRDQVFTDTDGTANYAGVNWASELTTVAGASELLLETADRYLTRRDDGMSQPLDPTYRVEDMFFAATILRRASDLTADLRYLDVADEFLLAAADHLLQPDGIYWHSLESPYFWGRGNGFAALGYSEALRGKPTRSRADLIDRHVQHLRGLRKHQDAETGMWRQVIDEPSTYTESSATCMIGISIASGIQGGWLDADEWLDVVNAAWDGIANGVGDDGEVTRVCVGTGPLGTIDEYRQRDHVTGHDDRGGAMALWFAVEMLRLRQR